MNNEDLNNAKTCIQDLSNTLGVSSKDTLEILLKSSKVIKYEKHNIIPNNLLKETLCIVIKGIVRYFANDERIEDQTLRFAFSNEILSLHTDSRNREEQLQAISDCAILTIQYNVLDGASKQNELLKTYINRTTFAKLKYEIYLLRMSPEERYKILIKRYKHIFLLIPLKYIASYLNITPQALCRIRKRIIQKDRQK
jgi:CRP-like cAMP-binding protein